MSPLTGPSTAMRNSPTPEAFVTWNQSQEIDAQWGRGYCRHMLACLQTFLFSSRHQNQISNMSCTCCASCSEQNAKTFRIKSLSSHGRRQASLYEVNQTWACRQAAFTSQFICTLSPFETELGVAWARWITNSTGRYHNCESFIQPALSILLPWTNRP